MMSARFRVVLIFLLVIASVRSAAAQDPAQPQPTPTFRSRIDLVRVDVSVMSRDGTPVADLQPSDFDIEEDGVRQEVATLQFVRVDGTRTSDLDHSLEIRSPEHAAAETARDDVRLFAIFLDDYHVDKRPALTFAVHRALREFLDQLGPNDLVVLMEPLTPLSHLRFTRSRDEILEWVNAFEGRRGQVFPVKSIVEENQLTQRNTWELRGGVTLSALGALVTRLGGLREGRKSVLFVSQGPPVGGPSSPNWQRLEEVLQAANRANVTIHVFDPRSLGDGPFGGAAVLRRLANETGGRVIAGVNHPWNRMDEIVADASAYYLLGYAPARDVADGKFHRIEVKVKRRGVSVVARRGYWAPTGEELAPDAAAAALDPAVVEALSALAEPPGGRAAQVWIGTSRAPDGSPRLTISWQPSGGTGARPATHLEVERLDEGNGAAPDATARIAAEPDQAAIASFDLEGNSPIELRFTMYAVDGEVLDRWHESLEIPALAEAPLALATPRFLRARSATEAQAIAAGREHPPAAGRQFRATDRVWVELDCYVAAPVPAAVTVRLLNASGEPVLELASARAVDGPIRLHLPLSSLAPSTYVLHVEARAGEHETDHHAAFRVGS